MTFFSVRGPARAVGPILTLNGSNDVFPPRTDVVLGVTSRLLVINILLLSPAINKLCYLSAIVSSTRRGPFTAHDGARYWIRIAVSA